MKNNKVHSFIKKIVEEGTEYNYTLLHTIKVPNDAQNMQCIMQQTILIKNNTCKHSLEVVLGHFIQSNKECKVCSPEITAEISSTNRSDLFIT